MKRLTLEVVEALYQKTGLRPASGVFVHRGSYDTCACPIGAYLIEEGMNAKTIEDTCTIGDVMELMMENGFTMDYLEGFVDGFDDCTTVSPGVPAYDQGWEDGQTALNTLVPASS